MAISTKHSVTPTNWHASRPITVAARPWRAPDDPPFDPFADDDDVDYDLWLYDDHRRHLEAGLPLRLDRRTEPHERRWASSAIVEHAEEEITALLKANWPAVERVAGALAKQGQLSQAELDRVVAHGQR